MTNYFTIWAYFRNYLRLGLPEILINFRRTS